MGIHGEGGEGKDEGEKSGANYFHGGRESERSRVAEFYFVWNGARDCTVILSDSLKWRRHIAT
jgi:hypothetical protein